jgi:hypothetical protein
MHELRASGPDEPGIGSDPMIACATASVTTSASVRIRLAFFAGSGRKSSAVQNTEISKQVEVGEHRVPPRSTVRLGTADVDLTTTHTYPTAAASAVELLIY